VYATPRRVASRRVASRRVVSPGVAETRLGTTTKSFAGHVQLSRAVRKTSSLPISLSLFLSHSLFHDTADGELGRRPSAPECCAMSRAAPIVVSQSTTGAFGREKVFPPRTFETDEMELRLVAKLLALHLFSSKLFGSDSSKSLTT